MPGTDPKPADPKPEGEVHPHNPLPGEPGGPSGPPPREEGHRHPEQEKAAPEPPAPQQKPAAPRR
jgi:hypothetical protein